MDMIPSLDTTINFASNLWEKTKESIIDTVGVASDYVFGETYINDEESRKILSDLDKYESECKNKLIKIHLLRQHLLDHSSKIVLFADVYVKSFEQNSSLYSQFLKYSQDCQHFAEYSTDLAEKRIPLKLEMPFDEIVLLIKNLSKAREDFTQNCLKAERLKTTILQTLGSSSPERVIELQTAEEETRNKISAAKLIFSVNLGEIDTKFKEAQETVLKLLVEYQIEFLDEIKKISQ